MTGAELVAVLDAVTTTLEGQSDDFRRLDAAVGDGDLGITVRMASVAVGGAIADLEDPTVAEVLRTSAMAIANANPSTMAALVAAGLLKAAKAVGDDPVDLQHGTAAGQAFHDAVAARGKADPGDKTILDAVGPSLGALQEAVGAGHPSDRAVEAAATAAEEGAARTTDMVGRRGRARWVAKGGQGQVDPGAVLYARFLRAWQDAVGQHA